MPFLYGDSLTVVVAVMMSVIIRNNRWAGMKNKVFSSICIAKKFNDGVFFDSTHYYPICDCTFTPYILNSTTIFLLFFQLNSVPVAFLLFGEPSYTKYIHLTTQCTMNLCQRTSFNFKFIFGPDQYFLTCKLIADFNFL